MQNQPFRYTENCVGYMCCMEFSGDLAQTNVLADRCRHLVLICEIIQVYNLLHAVRDEAGKGPKSEWFKIQQEYW